MTLDEARIECERWLAYLERQKAKSMAIQKIATARYNHLMDEKEARRQIQALDSALTVYDGAKLAEAVRTLLKFNFQ